MTYVTADPEKSIANLVGASVIIPEPDSPFFMSKEEWVHLQVYTEMVSSLPISAPSIKEQLGLSEQSAVDDETLKAFDFIEPMAGIFSAMNEHCHTWQTVTYPEVVGVAHRISEYATTVPARARTLQNIIGRIGQALRHRDSATVERLLVTVDKLAHRLIDDTVDNQSAAQKTSGKIKLFAEQTDNDKRQLTNLRSTVLKKKEFADGTVDEISAEIKSLTQEMNSLQQEYTTAVVVAATTPTYLLVPIVGWIACPIVAGIFGVRAGDLKKGVDKMSAMIRDLQAEKAQKVWIMTAFDVTVNQIDPVKEMAESALAVLDKAKGIWESIAADIGAIPSTLRSIIDDPDAPDDILMAMDLSTAVDQWAKVREEADQFRVNAYVRFTADEKTV